MITINPLQHAPLTGRSSQPQPGQPTRNVAQPQPGQLLKGLVLEARAGNEFLLQLGDNQILARSDAVLRPGQTLQLQLLATSPNLQLQIVNDTLNPFLGRSLTLVGNTIDLASIFQSLQQSSLFQSLSLHARQTLEAFLALQQSPLGKTGSGAALKQMVDRFGLAFEHVLLKGDAPSAATTLKAALLEVMANSKAGSQVNESVGRTLATLEFFQLAQLHSDSAQQLLFPLPFTFIEQGFLLIERSGEDGRDNDYKEHDYRFSLHLKLTELGNLQIDIYHNPEGLFIRFHTDSQEKADFIAEYVDDLKDAVSDAPVLGISFAPDAQDPASVLVRHIIPEGRSVLDTTA